MSKYQELKEFISSSMRMSHIYQPVMLIELLKRKNCSATVEQIAKRILNRDLSQIEYYSNIVKEMPGKVLTNNRDITEVIDGKYFLKDYKKLSDKQKNELILLCEKRINKYEEKKSGSHWDHRKKNHRLVPGPVRYQVLKRAKSRCELCGISAKIKALEVDHIVPKNWGGKHDISNYQALCYTCNSQKRDTDSEDFRKLELIYKERKKDCVFCELEKGRIISENTLAFAMRDKYPVSKGHTLIIPKRHVSDYFSLFQPEINATNQLIKDEKIKLQKDKSIEGFNIGVNCGEAAGQTVFHCHIHLIPRRKGDVKNPRGGVRHVISGKGDYSMQELVKQEKLT